MLTSSKWWGVIFDCWSWFEMLMLCNSAIAFTCYMLLMLKLMPWRRTSKVKIPVFKTYKLCDYMTVWKWLANWLCIHLSNCSKFKMYSHNAHTNTITHSTPTFIHTQMFGLKDQNSIQLSFSANLMNSYIYTDFNRLLAFCLVLIIVSVCLPSLW